MSSGKFIIIYVLFLAPTYIWGWVFGLVAMGASMDGAMASEEIADTAVYGRMFLLAISYVVMAFVAYRRGLANNRRYLIAFPIIGAVFDLFLAFIPFVPSVFNFLGLILGAMSNPTPQDPAK